MGHLQSHMTVWDTDECTRTTWQLCHLKGLRKSFQTSQGKCATAALESQELKQSKRPLIGWLFSVISASAGGTIPFPYGHVTHFLSVVWCLSTHAELGWMRTENASKGDRSALAMRSRSRTWREAEDSVVMFFTFRWHHVIHTSSLNYPIYLSICLKHFIFKNLKTIKCWLSYIDHL